jgi:hypothetical protein
MEDPQDLRTQARRWRRLARFHDTATAVALIEAARRLERKADDLTGGGAGDA